MTLADHLVNKFMLPDSKVKNVDINGDGKVDGYKFKLGSPFYTAQPISAIWSFTLKINGELMDNEKITLIIRGMEIPVTKALTFHEISWRFWELMDVYVEKPGGLAKGEYNFSVLIMMRTTIDYGYKDDMMPQLAEKTMMVED